jgi:hypothetical protein
MQPDLLRALAQDPQSTFALMDCELGCELRLLPQVKREHHCRATIVNPRALSNP